MRDLLHTHTARHLAASACASHGLRNLLAPAQLRLDVWMLQGESAVIGVADAAGMRAAVQDVLRLVDGLDLLAASPLAQPPISATPWPDAVGALLSCISAGSPCTLDVGLMPAETLDRIPRSLLAHVFAEAALVAHEEAPHAHAEYALGVSGDTIALRATFRCITADRRGPLRHALMKTLPPLLDVYARETACLAITTDRDALVCCVDLPIGPGDLATGSDPAPSILVDRFSVLCIDDNDALMDALEARLRSTHGFSHFVRSRSVADALVRLDEIAVSLVLLDVHLGVAHDPFTSISLLRARCPDARIALFSGHADSDVVERALAHGADGFVYKGAAGQQLIDGIVRLARGERVVLQDD
jgi:CheY-like chemotaxis protein